MRARAKLAVGVAAAAAAAVLPATGTCRWSCTRRGW